MKWFLEFVDVLVVLFLELNPPSRNWQPLFWWLGKREGKHDVPRFDKLHRVATTTKTCYSKNLNFKSCAIIDCHLLSQSYLVFGLVRYTLKKRLLIVKTYYKNGENVIVTIREIPDQVDLHHRPSLTLLVIDTHKRSTENIAAVSDSVSARSNISIQNCCQEINLYGNTLQRMLKSFTPLCLQDLTDSTVPVLF